MNILGIDQSITSSGIVILSPKNKIIHLQLIKTNSKDRIEDRLIYIKEELKKIIDEYSIEKVYIEGVSFVVKNSSSVRILGGLYYYLLVFFYEEGIEVTTFTPSTIKKFALKGNSKKEEMFNVIPNIDKNKLIGTGAKKTTGLYDLSDAYFISKMGFEFNNK